MAFYNYLTDGGFTHDSIELKVKSEFECTSLAKDFVFERDVKLPQLFKLYMDIGTKVCSPPALDRTFKTIDFLILLDKESLSEQSKALFLR